MICYECCSNYKKKTSNSKVPNSPQKVFFSPGIFLSKNSIFFLKNPKIIDYAKNYSKFLFPHILAVLISFVFIILQRTVNEVCFLTPNCNCSGLIIKLYTSFKLCFFYWNFIILIVYFLVFAVPLYRSLKLKVSYLCISYGIILAYYMSRDCTQPNENEYFLNSYFAILTLFSFLFFGLYHKFKFFVFFQKIKRQLAILLVCYGDFLFSSLIFTRLHKFLEIYVPGEEKGICQLVMSLYFQILFSFFRYNLLKYSNLSTKGKFHKEGAFFFFRTFMMKIFAFNFSVILLTEIGNWKSWSLFASHIFFLMDIFFKIDALGRIYRKSKNALYTIFNFKRTLKMGFSLNESEKKVEQQFPIYIIDFQHLFLFRTTVFWLTENWFGINIIEFYEDCTLKKSEKFVFQVWMFLWFAGTNILSTGFFIFYEFVIKRKKLEFEIHEVFNFKNCFVVLFLNWVFEVQLQEYYALLLSNNE